MADERRGAEVILQSQHLQKPMRDGVGKQPYREVCGTERQTRLRRQPLGNRKRPKNASYGLSRFHADETGGGV